jgi:hypothetical protein
MKELTFYWLLIWIFFPKSLRILISDYLLDLIFWELWLWILRTALITVGGLFLLLTAQTGTWRLFVHYLITLLSSFTQCLLWNLFRSLSKHVSNTWYLQTSKELSNELHYQFHPCDPISCNVRINVNRGRVVAYVFYTIISHGGHVYAMLSTQKKIHISIHI